jgi:serine/threonine protein kinase
MFHEGQKIGSYKLLTKIGKGGFGEVWLAEKRSELVTKKVAVKLPFEDQIDLETIKQEAELWEQASGHANVLPIIDADIIDGQVLIVSEYAEGGSLHDKLRREGKLSIKQAVEMTIGILNGLEFLHHKRIIHRDIKPQNILLQGDTPRLADFGISRAMQTVAVSSTIIGTDSYMSPETFEGKRSIQTDIWAVGVVLYQLLKGSLPFPQEHPSERMFAIIQKDFELLPDEVPFKLQQIIKKALAKLPENRFESASQMRDDLQHFVSSIQSTINVQNQPTEVLLAETLASLNPTVSVPTEKSQVETAVMPQFVQYVKPQGNRVTNKNNNSLWIAFGAVAFVLGGGFFLAMIINLNNSRQSDTAKVANTNKTSSNSTTPKLNTNANVAATAERNLGEISLPNGTKLQAYPGGIEDQLIKFIQSNEYKNGTSESMKAKWFSLDDLSFRFGTLELTPESNRQLNNLVAILKCFPDVKIKIGGFTDKKGDDAANLKLSDGRAKAVKSALEKAGVGTQVPQAEGYGESSATVPETATDEERKADRKTAVRLIKDGIK